MNGEAAGGERLYCDDCLTNESPWSRGRAALAYAGGSRKLVLALKTGDRSEIARVVAPLLARAGKPLIRPDTLIVPIPLHWSRRMGRRYNQAALLVLALGRQSGTPVCPDALGRTRPLDFPDDEARLALLDGAIAANVACAGTLKRRPILLVDDVMTSGATFRRQHGPVMRRAQARFASWH